MTVPDGIDERGVTDWFSAHVEGVEPPLAFATVQGGRSNLTFVVADRSGRRWVLRRPPLHAVLESAHDMGREHRIISALRDCPVPVPPTIGYETDTAVTGAPFYVMDFVEGDVIRDEDAARTLLDADRRRTVGEQLVDILVELHEVDPDAVGLGDLARRDGYIERQLRRWHGQLVKGHEHGARELPVLDEVFTRLSAAIPEQQGVAIVHGDYRLDNVIVGPTGSIDAVLDWELCTLGDPLADLGLLAVYWSDPGDVNIPLLSAPTNVEGFPRREEVVARYAAGSGRDVSALGYYVAFANWKLAIILEGVRARFASGAYGHGVDDSWQRFDQVVTDLGETALAKLA